MDNLVAAIVVTYNRKTLLAENINALLSQTRADKLDVIIIDNASNDGTYDEIKPLLDSNNNLYYTNTGDNLGGAGGFSYGIKYALQRGKYKYLWIMDDDTIPNYDSLEKLLDAIRGCKGRFGFLSSRVVWTDGSQCKMNRVTLMSKQHDQYIRAKRATFVSLLINVKAVRKCGLPIKEFFIWGDDKEYTDRLSKSFKNYYIPESVVVHKMAENVGSCLKNDKEARIDRYIYAFRNDFYTARRNGIFEILLYFAVIAKTTMDIIFVSPSHKKERLKALYTGMLQGFSFFPMIEYVDELQIKGIEK